MDEMIKLVKSKIDIDEEIIEDAIDLYAYAFQCLYDSGIDISEFFEKKENGIGIKERFYKYALDIKDPFVYKPILDNDRWRKYTSSKKLEKYIYLYRKYKIRLNNMDEINEYVDEFEDGYKPTIQLYKLALFNEKIYTVLLLDDASMFDDLEPLAKSYRQFIIRYGINCLSPLIEKYEDIKDYFDEQGPKKKLYEDILFKVSNIIKMKETFDDENWIKIYNPSPEVIQYLKFRLDKNIDINKIITEEAEVYTYFTEYGPRKELYDLCLKNEALVKQILIDDDWKKYYNDLEPIKHYLEFLKEINCDRYFILKINKAGINNCFDNNGPTKKMYEMCLFSAHMFKYRDLCLREPFELECKENEILQCYIEFIEYVSPYNFNFDYFKLNTIEDLKEYFDSFGPKDTLYEACLFDRNSYLYLLSIKEVREQYNAPLEVQYYMYFLDKYGFDILSSLKIKYINDLYTYFDSYGPTVKLYEESLFDNKLFECVFNDVYFKDKYISTYEIKQYMEFIKKYGFILNDYINSIDDINYYFKDKGLNLSNLLMSSLNNIQVNKIIVNNNNKLDFEIIMFEQLFKNKNDKIKAFLENNWIKNNIFILLNIIKKLDLENDNINIELPNICELFNCYSVEQLLQVCKYILYSYDDIFDVLSTIIKNGKIEQFNRIYYYLFKDWNIKTFKLFITNFYNNMELCNNIDNFFNQTNKPTIAELNALKKILIYGDKNAVGVVKTIEDLDSYNELIYQTNEDIIENSLDIILIKQKIFNLLFNKDSFTTELKKFNYENDRLNSLIDSVNDLSLKEKIISIKLILEFIDSIDKENDIVILKKSLKIINDMYKNNSEMLVNIHKCVNNIDEEIRYILGLEIKEKNIDFDELIKDSLNDNIPLSKDGQPLYNVSSCSVVSDCEYDGVIISKGIEVSVIELTGYPFVMLAHVLNAYGSGGRLSYFNHPLLIGRTHISLSAIGDTYSNVINNEVTSIDSVRLLFTDLPEKNFFIGSEYDVWSESDDNNLNIKAASIGNYCSIRDNIGQTGNYNEYVYYRDNIRPTGILVSGEEPNGFEIQAAAYLNVPLVKINKDYYPYLVKEERKEKNKQLKEFYQKKAEEKRLKENEEYKSQLRILKKNIIDFVNSLNYDEDDMYSYFKK